MSTALWNDHRTRSQAVCLPPMACPSANHATIAGDGLPALEIEPACWAKLSAFVQGCPAEISGLGAVRAEIGRHALVVDDVYLLPQRVTSATTEIDATSVAGFLADWIEAGKDVTLLRLWWHSHYISEPFISHMDAHTLSHSLAGSPWYVALVLNQKGQAHATLQINEPVSLQVDLQVALHLDPVLRADVQAEIHEKVLRVSSANRNQVDSQPIHACGQRTD